MFPRVACGRALPGRPSASTGWPPLTSAGWVDFRPALLGSRDRGARRTTFDVYLAISGGSWGGCGGTKRMAQEFSFDVVSKVDMQELKNAVDQTLREIGTRFDFKGSV